MLPFGFQNLSCPVSPHSILPFGFQNLSCPISPHSILPFVIQNLSCPISPHTAYCPLVFRISVAQFYHTSYCPLVFSISRQLPNFTTHSILPYCPLVFRISRQLPNFTTHTQHSAAWFSESQDINWFLPISPQIQHCPSDFRISGCKPAVANFTTDLTLPF